MRYKMLYFVLIYRDADLDSFQFSKTPINSFTVIYILEQAYTYYIPVPRGCFFEKQPLILCRNDKTTVASAPQIKRTKYKKHLDRHQISEIISLINLVQVEGKKRLVSVIFKIIIYYVRFCSERSSGEGGSFFCRCRQRLVMVMRVQRCGSISGFTFHTVTLQYVTNANATKTP